MARAPIPDTSMFLTDDELHQLTGRKQPLLQIEWLRDRGWQFEVNERSRPVVLAAYAIKRLGGGEPQRIIDLPDFTVLMGK